MCNILDLNNIYYILENMAGIYNKIIELEKRVNSFDGGSTKIDTVDLTNKLDTKILELTKKVNIYSYGQ